MNPPCKTILTSIDQKGVATLTLNRPECHNAFDDVMINEMIHALLQLEEDKAVKIIVLKSTGKNFSAGADLTWMQKMAHFTEDENIHDAMRLGKLMYTLYYCQKPTIAMVQGAVYGGGVGLVACSHIAIASTDATFCFSEAKLGLIPAVISPYIINAIGIRQTRAYFLTANSFDATTAKQIGLCFEVVKRETLEEKTNDLILTLLHNGPTSVQSINSLLKELSPHPITELIVEKTVQRIASIRVSPEGQEGLKAFLEKRKPAWCQDLK